VVEDTNRDSLVDTSVHESIAIAQEPEEEYHVNDSVEVNETESVSGNETESVSGSEEMDPDVEPEIDKTMSIIDVAREWILKTSGRNCSDLVANELFELAWDLCFTLCRIRKENGGKRPNFKDLREKIMMDVDCCKMDFIFEDLSLPIDEREKERIHILDRKTFPRQEYPSDKYRLVYQMTKIPVISFIY